ncbi:hypothetical protein LWI29_033961 [Acer saccharum]|uniref:Uncharacterized protein n=1 Tax=Acer saccharum TaxID=4024 RepID=A0AA39SHX6_ACESA|nr:hypothetical protein LWI29_033961 [Acer saccharum]
MLLPISGGSLSLLLHHLPQRRRLTEPLVSSLTKSPPLLVYFSCMLLFVYWQSFSPLRWYLKQKAEP